MAVKQRRIHRATGCRLAKLAPMKVRPLAQLMRICESAQSPEMAAILGLINAEEYLSVTEKELH